jgi:hypothetical protein
MKLPDLQTGRTYTHDEVRAYLVATEPDDWVKAAQHWLPKDRDRGLRLHDDEPMRVEYTLMPTCELEPFIKKRLETCLSKRADYEDRVQDILKLIEGGAVAFPVFVPGDDPERKIFEGMHRAVAFWRHGAKLIPVFLMK